MGGCLISSAFVIFLHAGKKYMVLQRKMDHTSKLLFFLLIIKHGTPAEANEKELDGAILKGIIIRFKY